MIFLRISCKNESIVEQIGNMLLKEKLIIDVNIHRNIERMVYANDVHQKESVTLLTSKTKGLLFSKIDESIRAQFPNENLEIYSIPIVHMDWEDMKHIKEDVQGV
ncbi:MAG: hypothetical protein ACI8XB_000498 [Patiriisocius sp.]|jgi:uncharacterized protein involved in tolerance to divalent cations